MTALLALAISVSAVIVSSLRWLRVAQREHYIPWSVSRFAARWFGTSLLNVLLGATLTIAAIAAWLGSGFAAVAASAATALGLFFWPIGLPMRGTTGKLAWTRRLRTLAAVLAAVAIVVAVPIAVLRSTAAIVVIALLLPGLVDLALTITKPLERRALQRHVRRASHRLRSVAPLVVAITGSYGKTSTKQYVRHLLSTTRSVVASPASFNNMAGLCRAVNEFLTPGTEVFVAEVGTYGPGEIREICQWLKPEIGVITTIGPVHLERMRSLENITKAKSEILEDVRLGVLNVDDPRLAELARSLGSRTSIVRCSSADPSADVWVEPADGQIVFRSKGDVIAKIPKPTDAFLGNLVIAVAVAIAVGVPAAEIGRLLRTLPAPEHRQHISTTPDGIVVIDDTYNANPEGARRALAVLRERGANGGRRIVVTPGMVELGPQQETANREFAAAAAQVATDLVIVRRTNRKALKAGAAQGQARIQQFPNLPDAVAWLRDKLKPGDVVLYENDLPDHYP